MQRRTNTAVWMEKHNRWQIKVQKDNVRKTFYSFTPGKTGQREANAKADAWLDYSVADTKIKVSKTADEYLKQLEENASTSHYKQYSSYFRTWILPRMGNVRIENLNEKHFQDIINAAYSKGLSKKSLQNIRGCLQAWLKYCRKCKYTALLVEEITIPKAAPVGVKKILKPDDLDILLSSDNTFLFRKETFDIYVYAYRFEVLSGLRPGEVVELKRSDISGDGVVHVQRARNIYNEVTTGKNDNANRFFALNSLEAAILEEQRKMLDDSGIESEYIFPTKYGEPLKERSYYRRWCKYRDFNGITATTLYELRHTFVSVAKSLPEGYLKQVVGHSKNMDTYGIYSHEMKNDREIIAAMLEEKFKKIIGET
jgi:integrase